MLHNDVNALSELADRIFRSIPKGNTDNWGERFESIKELVDAEDWKNECEYYQLLYYDLNNDKGKFSEQIEAIVKNIKVDVHTDQRMLELLRSVILPTGQLMELLKLDDILIEKTDSSLMKLKYKFDKAIQLALVSDNTSAKKIADEVMAELEKEVKDFVEYKLSAYKAANPTKRSDLLPKSIYAFDIPNEIARVKRYREYAEYCLKQLEQMQKEG